MHLSRLLIALPLLVALGGCGGGMAIQDDYAPSVDFSNYQTYSWAEFEDPDIPAPPDIARQIKAAANDRMTAMGYELVEDDPDILLAYHLIVSEEIDINQYGFTPTWPPTAGTIDRYENGTIVLDVIDAGEERLVWRGWAMRALTDPYTAEPEEVHDVVDDILKQYPPQ